MYNQVRFFFVGIIFFSAYMQTDAKVWGNHYNEKPKDTLAPYNPNAILNEEAFFSLLDLDLPQLKTVKGAVSQKNWKAAKVAWAQYLTKREYPKWLWSVQNMQAIRTVFKNNFGGLSYYDNAAKDILSRKFSFDKVTISLPEPFLWRTGTPVWEQLFSRHAWLTQLGYAYQLTGNSAYALDFNKLIASWVQQHPVPPDVKKTWNGTDKAWMTLEIGLRMENWMDLMEAFRDAPAFDPETRYQMMRSLVEQIKYLDGWIVDYRIGNWQVSEATGMACVGIMFPEFKNAHAWREKAFRFLAAHMQKDVYNDGTQIEVTPGYHAGVATEYAKIVRLLRLNGYDSIPGILNKHEKMFDFLLDITQPDRKCPMVGDAMTSNMEDANALGAVLYNRADLRWLGPKSFPTKWIWMVGAQCVQQYNNMQGVMPSLKSVLLPDSKYAVMRTGWKPSDKYLLFDCAPSCGSHSHGDRLQVIAYAGRNFLIDPGQYSYAQPLVNYFKTAMVHNVLVIDSSEQQKVDPEVRSWSIGQKIEFVSGLLKMNKISHQRTVVFVKPFYWVITDHVKSADAHVYTRQFQFSAGTELQQWDNGVMTNYGTGANMLVVPVEKTIVQLKERQVPADFNKAANAMQACFSNVGDSSIFGTVLFPYDNKNQIPKIENTSKGDGILRISLLFPDGHINKILVSDVNASLQSDGISKYGTVLCININVDGRVSVIE